MRNILEKALFSAKARLLKSRIQAENAPVETLHSGVFSAYKLFKMFYHRKLHLSRRI